MKKICILTIAVLLVAAPIILQAQAPAKVDGAALFKEKCSMCHGEKGDGNKDMGMPAVKGTALTAEKLATFLLKGEKGKGLHENPFSGINEEQAKAIATFIKELK